MVVVGNDRALLGRAMFCIFYDNTMMRPPTFRTAYPHMHPTSLLRTQSCRSSGLLAGHNKELRFAYSGPTSSPADGNALIDCCLCVISISSIRFSLLSEDVRQRASCRPPTCRHHFAQDGTSWPAMDLLDVGTWFPIRAGTLPVLRREKELEALMTTSSAAVVELTGITWD